MTPAPASAKYLLFRLGTQALAFPFAEVREILPVAAVNRPPEAPRWLHGFLQLGKESLPVVELALLLGMPGTPISLQAHFIRLERGPLWLVDRVEQIVEAPELHPVPAAHFINEYALGTIAAGEEQTVVVLRPDALLLAEERQRLEEIAGRQQERGEHARATAHA